jgi:hypothetical protein
MNVTLTVMAWLGQAIHVFAETQEEKSWKSAHVVGLHPTIRGS